MQFHTTVINIQKNTKQRIFIMQLTGPEILKRMSAQNPDIVIRPFDERCLGSNSYDLHLGDTLKVYKRTIPYGMKPAIEYRGAPELHSMADWFDNSMSYNIYRDINSPDIKKDTPYREQMAMGNNRHPFTNDILNPHYLIDPTNPAHHETIDIKIPDNGLIIAPTIGYLGSTVEYTETRNLFPYIDGKSSVGRNFILTHHTAGRGDDGFCGEWTLEIHVLRPVVVYPYMQICQIYYEEFIGERKPYNKNKRSHYNDQHGPTAAAPIKIDNFLRDKQR